jgi:hypothetical protein
MAQSSEFSLRKPPGFHYDFFLLGITTFIAGLIGVPAPNGLIPQAPIHTTSLLVKSYPLEPNKSEEENIPFERQHKTPSETQFQTGANPRIGNSITNENGQQEAPVVEQRVSNLAQGSLCLVLLTGPLLHVLHLIPRGE